MRSFLLPAALALLAGCVAAADDTDEQGRRRKDARPSVDARTSSDVPVADAAPATGSGVVTCYTEGAPSNTCTAPDHCCFSNYSAQRNGYCTESACAYGTITCDGPEDCAPGDVCCAHAITDPDQGTTGYMLACQSTACGTPPLDVELCQPASGCSSGRTCVTAYGNQNDLPRTLYVCL